MIVYAKFEVALHDLSVDGCDGVLALQAALRQAVHAAAAPFRREGFLDLPSDTEVELVESAGVEEPQG